MHLSCREVQVVQSVVSGNTDKETAALLGLTLHTIRSYRKTAMKKLAVENAAALVEKALRLGIVGHQA